MRPIKEYQEWRLHESVRLRKNASSRSRSKMAENTRDPETLDLLSQDPDMSVRREVALNPNSTPEILDRLSRDIQSWIRAGVAYNTRTPSEILDRLSRENDTRIRECVAWNPNAWSRTLFRLHRDSDYRVRWCVARNPNAPISSLAVLIEDPNENVKRAADRALRQIRAARPELGDDRIEELKHMAELGIQGDGEAPDISDLDI